MQNFEFNIDAIDGLSLKIFDLEEQNYIEKKLFSLVSMLVITFLDLGIIELEEGDIFYSAEKF